MRLRLFISLLICLLPGLSLGAADDAATADNKRSFSLHVKNLVITSPEFSLFVLPSEALSLKVMGSKDAQFLLDADRGSLKQQKKSLWNYKAPTQVGVQTITILESKSNHRMRINVFTMRPSKEMKKGKLNGYPIGEYPVVALNTSAVSTQPEGFIEVTKETIDLKLSPHFTLGQFATLDGDIFPRYIALQEKLLLKLEFILEELHRRGVSADTLSIKRSFISPSKASLEDKDMDKRHLYGGAADIILDSSPHDGLMDDINGDGVLNHKDIQFMYDLIDKLSEKSFFQKYLGRLFIPRKKSASESFIHLDVRGVKSRG